MKKVHRFIGAYDLRATEIVLEDDVAHQIANVLKLKTGERVALCDGQGREAEYEILRLAKREVGLVRQGAAHQLETEPAHAITLYATILKRENFEWAVQKAVECGATEIVPVITERTIKKDVNVERMQAIAKEAAEQCGRGIVPEVAEPVKLEQALDRAKGSKLFFDAEGESWSGHPGTDASLFVGPEGGWTDAERENAKRAGAKLVSLGSRVLRGETAVPIAVFLAGMGY